jgi:hypothetical protein
LPMPMIPFVSETRTIQRLALWTPASAGYRETPSVLIKTTFC